jgi:predicted dithiol-disulfide oxidoreductase (DUF899 family)
MQKQVVSREEWLEARTALLEHEKALTRHRDEVSAERLALPWVRVEKTYAFDGPDGKLTLSELFQGRSQLYIKHFMMAPGAKHQCVGCSLEVDHMTDLLPHLENHDVSYAAVARAPVDEIEIVRKRMGWRFLWVSSFSNDFNYDFNVSFRPEDVAAGRAWYNFRPAPEWTATMQCRICQAGAPSTRTTRARSSTATRPMAAAARRYWASTGFSTPCRRGATRLAQITR